jgi:hypothetical protein
MDDLTEEYGQEFDSLAEWFGALYQLRGVKALKATLAELIASGECFRELLWEPAAELMAQGMSKPAIMVRDASLKCASVTDLDKFWPYSCEPNPASNRAAKASAEQQLKDYRSKAEPLLHLIGLSFDYWFGEEDRELIQSADEMKAAG